MTSFAARIAAIATVPALVFAVGACARDTTTTVTESPSVVPLTASPSPTTVDGVTVSGPLGQAPTIKVATGSKAPTTLVSNDVVVGTGAAATPSSSVTVQYAGVLYATGKPFNSSWADNGGQPVSFPLDGVIPGWQQGIPGMKEGGRRLLIIPPAMAYGAQGSPPAVPPNATLVFVVDLISTKATAPTP